MPSSSPASPPLIARRGRLRLATLAVALVAALATPVAVDARRPSPSASVEGMKVLITNDDGVQPGADSVGLFELRAALCDAGADVVVVAPWRNMSGASASITYGSSSTRFTLTEPTIDAAYGDHCSDAPSAGPVWGACVTAAGAPAVCDGSTPSLTPADAATLGPVAAAQLVGWDSPDVVVSGTNRGGNDGLNVNISGTVGAATIASSLGHPTIALSTSSSGAFVANAQGAAEWAVQFVGKLRHSSLLPDGYVLAVNYPRVDRGPVTEAEWTSVAQRSEWATGFTLDAGTTSFTSNYGPCTPGASCGAPGAGTDSVAYSSGRIAITPVSLDRTVDLSPSSPTIKDARKVRVMTQRGDFDAD
ncbi:MAG: hypothetical protein CL424_16105 [Acidimicrobiaceae bacterium]|nr:hypothetical protein [Acidimicrobiaceae bacterium]